MENQRIKICICYLISSFLIGIFIYTLLSNSINNGRVINRLKEEMDEIAHIVLHTPSGKPGESKQLSEIVDTMLKKRLAGIWDDLYTVKKQLKAQECSLGGRTKTSLGSVVEQRINYASEDLGAKIYHVRAEPASGTNIFKSLLRLDYSANPPISMIRPSMAPGSCFAFRNNKAEVTIRLSNQIFIDSMEMEHIAQSLSPTAETKSAPKKFSVFGLNLDHNKDEHLLGKFEYDNMPNNRIQSYPIKTACKFKYLRMKFESNHGHPNYTCVYRVAVFGRP